MQRRKLWNVHQLWKYYEATCLEHEKYKHNTKAYSSQTSDSESTSCRLTTFEPHDLMDENHTATGHFDS